MHIPTFHDPVLSCAQAALHQVLVRRGESLTEYLSAAHPKMRALVAQGEKRTRQREQAHSGGGVLSGIEKLVREVEGEVETIVHDVEGGIEKAAHDLELLDSCAGLFVDYCYASWRNEQPRTRTLYDELKFSTCDPLWLETVVDYEELKLMGINPIAPTPLGPGEGIYTHEGDLTIALVADWASGTPLARHVLAQAAARSPDLLIHLGDTYYAGTPTECRQHFVDVVKDVFPTAFQPGGLPVHAIPGNHEYYSGGVGFHHVTLPAVGQKSSYFCVRAPGWQVVALDTGYNDRDPFTVSSNVTSLTDDQVAWLDGVMATADGRRTILLTHHQQNSAVWPAVGSTTVDGRRVTCGVNQKLLEQLGAHLESVELWLWGHEHNTVVFDRVAGLARGRCIGSGAVPMLVEQAPYTPTPGLWAPPGLSVPAMDPKVELGNNGTDYYHGFAILSLRGDAPTVDYYQVPPLAPAEKLFSEPARRVVHAAATV